LLAIGRKHRDFCKFHRRRFSLCLGLPRSLPTRRIPRRAYNKFSTRHYSKQGREKFCKKTDVRSVLRGAEGRAYFGIDYWLLVIGYRNVDIQYQVALHCEIVSNSVALAYTAKMQRSVIASAEI